MANYLKRPQGTEDVTPDRIHKWMTVEKVTKEIAESFGFTEIRIPTFEVTELFQRSVGETTDVVQKEMYSVIAKETQFTLRPEGTAGTIRAMLQNGMLAEALPQKAFYQLSCFRHERPQAGRLREFHQFGVEMAGSASPYADAEVILLGKTVLDRLGIKDIVLNLNSIGCPTCRAKYQEALKAQAVALYTYAKYYNFNVSSTGHGYGKAPSQAAYAAVDAVYGQYLTYNSSTALTPFHAISAGKTTSYYNVWGTTSIPYLAGGRPSYGDYDAKDFSTSYTISSDELKSLVKSRCNVDLTGDPSQWLQIISHDATIDDDTGYVYSIRVGSEIYTGYKFRCDVMAGTLRSHCFKFVYTPNA